MLLNADGKTECEGERVGLLSFGDERKNEVNYTSRTVSALGLARKTNLDAYCITLSVTLTSSGAHSTCSLSHIILWETRMRGKETDRMLHEKQIKLT